MQITKRTAMAAIAAWTATLTTGAHAQTAPAFGQLSNPNASPQAKALYTYLCSLYGKKTLTGQQESIWHAGPRYELDYIDKVTGKLPAILGLDYIDPNDWPALADRATRWYKDEGGIPTLCWHWGVPTIGTGYENSKKYFDMFAAFKHGTPENTAMLRDIVAIGDQLTILRDRGVPVLWRPLHEFTGSWFWWGKCGPEAFKALWIFMYKYYTYERKLDNLIWVLGYTKDVQASYYPGRQYVDIAGADTYVDDHGPLADMFAAVKALVGDSVPICLHENGPIPDPDHLGPKADWLYFMTWHSEFIHDGKANPPDLLKRYYNSDRYITKDEIDPAYKPQIQNPESKIQNLEPQRLPRITLSSLRSATVSA